MLALQSLVIFILAPQSGHGRHHRDDKHDADKGGKHSQDREHKQSSRILLSRPSVLAHNSRAGGRIRAIYFGRINFLIVKRDSCCKHTRHHYHPYCVNHGNLVWHIIFLVAPVCATLRLKERVQLEMVPQDIDNSFTNADLKPL
jgi:hypothetical protein